MTTGTCRQCGGTTFHPGGGRPAALCDNCRGERPLYGGAFHEARALWAARIAAGGVLCLAPLCLEDDRHISPGQPWDLGHDPRGGIRGAEHMRCNRSAGGRARWGG